MCHLQSSLEELPMAAFTPPWKKWVYFSEFVPYDAPVLQSCESALGRASWRKQQSNPRLQPPLLHAVQHLLEKAISWFERRMKPPAPMTAQSKVWSIMGYAVVKPRDFSCRQTTFTIVLLIFFCARDSQIGYSYFQEPWKAVPQPWKWSIKQGNNYFFFWISTLLTHFVLSWWVDENRMRPQINGIDSKFFLTPPFLFADLAWT